MKTLFLSLLVTTGVLAPGIGAAGPSDRHPGVYQFAPISGSVCAGKERERRVQPRRERLQKLGDLPPAYVIRLTETKPPLYDPCATVEGVVLQRVR